MNGMELMLKSMGLGEVIIMAKTIADNGTVEKIIRFADSVETFENRLTILETKIDFILELIRNGKDEPGSRPAVELPQLFSEPDLAARVNGTDLRS